ncbi:hypothetical protein M5689_015690 [Euphorbia peplus]|nr:hypothetical protein M5689_015690 [Euphorbia peplus]
MAVGILFFLVGLSHIILSDKFFVDGRKISTSGIRNYTIQGENGEVIDCIDIYKQPAFSHPLLKNHNIQMRPSSSSPLVLKEEEKPKQFQRWQNSGKCPEGTIPILRTSLFAHSKRQFILQNTPQLTSLGNKYIKVAVVALPQGGKYYGANARLNLWNPSTYNGEYSLAQVIEDTPKLFIHWTRDNSNQTGCYNLNCAGFVQVNNAIALGGELYPVSTYDGPQFDLVISVHKDLPSGNWWVSANGQALGYYPGAFFTSLTQYSDQISWGGQISQNPNRGDPNHIPTEMGSGHVPSEGYNKAANIHSIQYINEFQQLVDADHDNNLMSFAPEPGCYGVAFGEKGKYNRGVNFFYGGPPPNSPNC